MIRKPDSEKGMINKYSKEIILIVSGRMSRGAREGMGREEVSPYQGPYM